MSIRGRIFFIVMSCLSLGLLFAFIVAERDLGASLQDQIQIELQKQGQIIQSSLGPLSQYNDLNSLKDETDVLKFKSFVDVTDIYLFDSKGYEKSQSFDHNLIKNIKLNKELMLAGNIKFDDNLKNYEKIANYLDLSGGLETSGLKDTSKINIFLNNLNKLINET